MANKWNDLKPKIFFGIVAFVILYFLSMITGEDDPANLLYNGFWTVIWVLSGISMLIFVFVALKAILKRK